MYWLDPSIRLDPSRLVVWNIQLDTQLDIVTVLWSDSAYGVISWTCWNLPFVLPHQSFHLISYRRRCWLCLSILCSQSTLQLLLIRFVSSCWWEYFFFLFLRESSSTSTNYQLILLPFPSSSRTRTCIALDTLASILVALLLSWCCSCRRLLVLWLDDIQEGFSFV